MAKSSLPQFQTIDDPDTIDILFIAGEHSGDEHAARLLKKCRKIQPDVKAAAIGGENLKKEGAQLLYNPLESAVVGFVEVLKHLDYLRALMDHTYEWIACHRPKVVCFVDYPGFNLRIANRLFKNGICSKAGGNVKLAYYISPQIWAWKAKRRFTMEQQLDGLGVIFPFELDSYRDTQLPVAFVGHPFVDPDYQLPVNHDESSELLLLPGSRRTPISRIFPIMVETFYHVKKQIPELKAKVMYPTENIKTQLETIVQQHGKLSDFHLIPNSESFQARAVLTSSGTISLVCALAAIPGILMYRTNGLTYLMAKILVKIRTIGIANIILGKSIHKEYLQSAMSPETMAKEVLRQLKDPEAIRQTRELSAELRHKLASNNPLKVAEWLLGFLDSQAM